MPRYFFPVLTVRPDGDLFESNKPPFGIARRKWDTSTFDLATLATSHTLHLPYQVMDVLLQHCHSEVSVEAEDLNAASSLFRSLRLGLYLTGQSPFLAPFTTTHSINDYSGINSRDSAHLAARLPEGLKTGFTSSQGKIEAWPFEMSFHCLLIHDRLEISEERFHGAVENALRWQTLQAQISSLRAVSEAAHAAPQLGSRDQSILHVWCAIEGLFPKVSTEVSFRVALYLAQLIKADDRLAYHRRVKKAYDLRSRLAHGSRRDTTHDEWLDAWGLLMDAINALLVRGALPDDDELLGELLK